MPATEYRRKSAIALGEDQSDNTVLTMTAITTDVNSGEFNRLNSWRRSFRHQHRSSMVELEPPASAPLRERNSDDQLCLVGPKPVQQDVDDRGIPYIYTGMRVRIRERYEFVDARPYCVGHGAYGDVFKGFAHDPHTSERYPVAIKRMAMVNVKPHELNAMKRVQNPFLVRLIDICHEKDDLNMYLIMELCHSDLDNYLHHHTTEGKLNTVEFALVMRDLARGYYALFKHNYVHRDIKPQNILLLMNRDGQGIRVAKLTDFGVCRMLDESDEEGGLLSNVAGTFYYMAPEVGANVLTMCEYGHSVDMWSIGCLMYQCYTGELPFNEALMCRLFLYCACMNYDAYEPPELPAETAEKERHVINALLEIDRDKRMTPDQFYACMVGVAPPMDTYGLVADRLNGVQTDNNNISNGSNSNSSNTETVKTAATGNTNNNSAALAQIPAH